MIMKKSKQLLSVFMALVLIFGTVFTMTAYADDTTGNTDDSSAVSTDDTSEPTSEEIKDFVVQIFGISDVHYSGIAEAKIPDDGKWTVSGVLAALDEQEESLTITFTESDYGAYVSDVNGDTENTFGKYDGWMYLVDGEMPVVGISACELEGGETITLYYGNASMQFPQVDDSKLESDGILSFFSMDTTYDDEGNAVVTKNPVVGATVFWSYDDETDEEYITDENGAIQLDKEKLNTAQIYFFDMEKYDTENEVDGKYLPLVFPLSFENSYVSVSAFTDIAEHWGRPYIKLIEIIGLVDGVTETTFEPESEATRRDLAEAVGRLAQIVNKEEMIDGVQWSIDHELFIGNENGDLMLDDPVNREQIFVIFARYLEAFGFELPEAEPTFLDSDEISDWAKADIGSLQAMGMVIGDGTEHINPSMVLNRASLVTLLSRLVEAIDFDFVG